MFLDIVPYQKEPKNVRGDCERGISIYLWYDISRFTFGTIWYHTDRTSELYDLRKVHVKGRHPFALRRWQSKHRANTEQTLSFKLSPDVVWPHFIVVTCLLLHGFIELIGRYLITKCITTKQVSVRHDRSR